MALLVHFLCAQNWRFPPTPGRITVNRPSPLPPPERSSLLFVYHCVSFLRVPSSNSSPIDLRPDSFAHRVIPATPSSWQTILVPLLPCFSCLFLRKWEGLHSLALSPRKIPPPFKSSPASPEKNAFFFCHGDIADIFFFS